MQIRVKQQFQRGVAYWVEADPNVIFFVTDSLEWAVVVDDWSGKPLDPVDVPANCLDTVRGFGHAWRKYQAVLQEKIGYATAFESACGGTFTFKAKMYTLKETNLPTRILLSEKRFTLSVPPVGNQARAKVGLHWRNEPRAHNRDFELLSVAGIEAVKAMSFADLFDAQKLRDADVDITVRLYDSRFGRGHHPTPAEFAGAMVPLMYRWRSFAKRYEVHNEPNHLDGIEGWGQEDAHAVDFNGWFLEVYDRIKQACPWASLGFPGLAIPHRDLEWVELCRETVERADWLGAHCYWQNPTMDDKNHLADFWGLRFKSYHDKFPGKEIEITEFGNSNCQGSYPVDWEVIAGEYVEFYTEVFKYPYLHAAHSFLISAPQEQWQGFTWREEGGDFRPVVYGVGVMTRPLLYQEPKPEPVPEPKPEPPEPPKPEPEPEPAPPEPTPVPEPQPEPVPDPTPLPDQGTIIIRTPERIVLPSGKGIDMSLARGYDLLPESEIKLRWLAGSVLLHEGGQLTVVSELHEILRGQDARDFVKHWKAKTVV